MILGFALAALISLVTFFVHTFVGGIYVVRPLLAAHDLTPASRWLSYYCWHIVTLLLLLMVAVFAAASIGRVSRDAAMLMTGFSAVLSLLSAAVALKGGIRPWQFPSTTLFLLMALAGGWGMLQP